MIFNVDCIMASDISRILNGILYGNDCLIENVSLNSKMMAKNTCFLAIKGKNFDGYNYIKEALENGAKLIITDRYISLNSPYVLVDDVILALGELAKFQSKGIKVIGITGSLGKTTVKNMVVSVLSRKYKVHGTEANENNEIGVPKTLLGAKNHDFCVVEMGMRGLGEIGYLASIALPTTVIVTNAKTSHIERLKTKENIFLAKMEILKFEPQNAILPYEKRFIQYDYKKTSPIFVGDGSKCFASDIKVENNSIKFKVFDSEKHSLEMKIYSKFMHNIQNALFAYKVGKIYGLTDKQIKNGLESYKQESMREEEIEVNGITIINDSYNSAFESLTSAIISVERYANLVGKKFNVLIGDILEAGSDKKQLFEKVKKQLKRLNVKNVFVFNDELTVMFGDLENSFGANSYKEMAKIIYEKLDNNDILLVKASRGVGLERVIEEMKGMQNE